MSKHCLDLSPVVMVAQVTCGHFLMNFWSRSPAFLGLPNAQYMVIALEKMGEWGIATSMTKPLFF